VSLLQAMVVLISLVFEAINMAVVLQLPAVFIFENNGYGEWTGHDYAVGGRGYRPRAAGFGLPAGTVDGTDFFAVTGKPRRSSVR
jgi:pyruvate dehydrogenase E1 component alpha subunit